VLALALTWCRSAPPTEQCSTMAGHGSVKGVASGQTRDTYRFCYRAGPLVEVFVFGDGSTNLNCYAYDTAGHLVDADTDATDNCFLRWFPGAAGPFTIEVRNLGQRTNDYIIESTQ
jgi:hypothetical protein